MMKIGGEAGVKVVYASLIVIKVIYFYTFTITLLDLFQVTFLVLSRDMQTSE